jgi:hypothetical protein
VARLRADPERFGELRFTLAHAHLEVRVAAVPPILVVYGVNKERSVVYFLPLPGTDF